MTTFNLTTTFSPAPSCTADFYTSGIYYSIGGPSPSQCFPSGWASTSQFFSPGLCPSGYTQACSSLSSLGKNTETRATCCPTGYNCYTGAAFNFQGQACVSIFPSQITTTVTDAKSLTPILATLHSSTEAVNGYGVSIRYQSTDFGFGFIPVSTAIPSFPSSTISSTASSTTSSNVSSTSPGPSSNPSSSLSTGAKAGVGVGVALVAVIALAGAFVFFRRRRRIAGPRYETGEARGGRWKGYWGGVPKPPKVFHEADTPPVAELAAEDTSRA